MGEKSHYNYRVEPQDVDFTLRATIPSLGSAILNTAGIDAHGKGFGVDALNADNHSWVLSRMAVEFDCQPGQYTDYTIATWINEYGRVLSTRNFTLTDAAGNEFGAAVTQWAMIDLRSRFGARPVVGGRCPCRRHRRSPPFADRQAAKDPRCRPGADGRAQSRGTAPPRQVERRTAPQVDHRPLRHRTPEFVARGVGQREITRRRRPPSADRQAAKDPRCRPGADGRAQSRLQRHRF